MEIHEMAKNFCNTTRRNFQVVTNKLPQGSIIELQSKMIIAKLLCRGVRLMRQSFIVDITHQQNASWQGTITWLNENKTMTFRSALELIRLIDTAMESEQKPEWREEPP